jgi:uncharacterized protein
MTEHSAAGELNRLGNETSPYLLQHAHNPVDWYPWGPEALARAAAEDKPILLSVGYSACHWCHVMAHESFENPEIAALMNQLFVNVKVDREERPDIDAIYMEAVQAMTGHGGWPMTVFLTPEGKPFYGGTYFPPEPRHNMPSFPQLLLAIADAWRERRNELVGAGERLSEALSRSALLQASKSPVNTALLDRAVQRLVKSHDRHEGGFGGAPKFPQPTNLDFLLQRYLSTKDPVLLQVVTLTLTKMAQGGIYDQLGGGFHRYSTDDEWLVPHFEKMLYDNAQLARTYLHAWQITGNPLFKRITQETLDYILREMTSSDGAFYSTQDADSEGEEGKFFLWTLQDVMALLGEEDGRLFAGYFGVTSRGNFREGGPGANILHIRRDVATVAADTGVSESRLEEALARGKQVLFAARKQRVHPGRDDKVLAEWNGLMLHAFSEAGAALVREDYLVAAESAASFLLGQMSYDSDGMRLYRTYKDGRAHLNGYLEDYAAVGLGLLALYQVTFDLRWLGAADDLRLSMFKHFHDSQNGGFFQVADDHEELVVRRKDFVDSAMPAGNSMAAELLWRLGRLLDRADYGEHAAATIAIMADGMADQPGAFGRLLSVAHLYLEPGYEVAVVGPRDREDTRALLGEVYQRFLPSSVVALRQPGDAEAVEAVPLLADRTMIEDKAAAYVCRNYVCNLPVTDPARLRAQLEA